MKRSAQEWKRTLGTMTLSPLSTAEPTIVVPTPPKVPNRLLLVYAIERAEEREDLDGDVRKARVGFAPEITGVRARRMG